ncbi:MAG: hypothetical protein ACI4GC_01120 [Acutalibacteraceae bacterium]
MKKILSKAIALLLSLIMVFSVTSIGVAASYENDLPVVYLRGATEKVYDKNGNQVWPVTTSITDMLIDNRKPLLAAFSASLATSDWSIYGDALNLVLNEYYQYGALDNNGNPKNGTTIKNSPKPKVKSSDFGIGDYVFRYDPRLDPWETADLLNSYINSVLAATGKKKVQLVSRCMGCCFASAYLCKYGADKVDTAIYYASAAKGSTVCGELFYGKLKFDENVLNNYADTYMGDDELSSLLAGVISITYSLSLLGAGTGVVTDIFNQMSVEVWPQLLRTTFANMPAYWAMVSEDYYEGAKNFVFGGYEAEYAGLIKKIDNYHQNVMLKLDSDLKTFVKNGMKIVVLAKYNRPFPPYIESSQVQGDGRINMDDIAFGAVGADIGTYFDVTYLNEARLSGTIDYISDDLTIDTSTALFPNNTWYVKNIKHGTFPPSINVMIMDILHKKKQVTVNDFAEYPQFMDFDYDTDTLSPIEAAKPSGDAGTTNILFTIIEKIMTIFNMIKNFFGILIK